MEILEKSNAWEILSVPTREYALVENGGEVMARGANRENES